MDKLPVEILTKVIDRKRRRTPPEIFPAPTMQKKEKEKEKKRR